MSPHSILLMPSRRDLRAVASIGLVRPKARMRSMQALLSAVLARAILKEIGDPTTLQGRNKLCSLGSAVEEFECISASPLPTSIAPGASAGVGDWTPCRTASVSDRSWVHRPTL